METDWVSKAGDFWGTTRQITCCAKCGQPLKGGHDTPQKVADAGKPSMHFLCEGCYSELPD